MFLFMLELSFTFSFELKNIYIIFNIFLNFIWGSGHR